jgi:hypothetical protein
MPSMHRRTLLSALGAAALGGCLDSDLPAVGDDTPDLPEECPVSQDLGVEWPEDLDADSAETFVETYENVYYRERVVAYEPETPLDSYQLRARVEDVRSVGEGYEVAVSGNGGVYRPGLHFSAHRGDSAADAERVDASAVEDHLVSDLLTTAAEEGEADAALQQSPDVERYNQLFGSLFEGYDPLDAPGDSETLYFSVDGTPVELEVQADRLHGDYWWSATYYVDEHVVYRAEEDGSPKDGKLLECRTEV